MNFEDAKTALELWESIPRTREAIITNYFGDENDFRLTLLLGAELTMDFHSLQDVRDAEEAYANAVPVEPELPHYGYDVTHEVYDIPPSIWKELTRRLARHKR